MPTSSLSAYMERLPARKAELSLVLLEATSIPHMKKDDRKRAVNQLKKIARQHEHEVAKVASPARLRMMGIGVQFEPASVE